MPDHFYITTTLPYVNADPHIGFALELIQADAIARWHKQKGEDVIFNTGTDEHGSKVYRKAIEEGKNPQEYADEREKSYERLIKALNLSVTNFIRTTDSKHVSAAQKFWGRCLENGDIYKQAYKIKYCVGCELEKTDSELVGGKCSLHPNLDIEEIEEENYFFRFSKYQKTLLEFYENNPDFVLPSFRFNEIKQFVKEGLRDFSISRLKSKMPWGVPVPNDDEQVMYVWFDALVNYISTIGWPFDGAQGEPDESKFKNFWPGVQIAGKDNLRQQSAIWQAMLFSAGLPNSKQILIHGFITADGQKMSKSLGNVVDPFKLAEKYGVDAVRYFLLREIPSGEDGDFSEKKLIERYNSDLANGLGNLVQRVSALISTKLEGEINYSMDLIEEDLSKIIEKKKNSVDEFITAFKLHNALGRIWELIEAANKYINDKKPWELNDKPEELIKVLANSTELILEITNLIHPFLPQTADRIFKRLNIQEADSGKKVILGGDNTPLFPVIEK